MIRRLIHKRMSAATLTSLNSIPEVDIDESGVFKYILIDLKAKLQGDKLEAKTLVRGYGECNFHADINDVVTEELQKMKENGELSEWTAKVLGGGRIIHEASKKTIKVYGYSQAFGKADHATTVDLLKKVYADYNISWSDEGY